jgi:hypothetical protein
MDRMTPTSLFRILLQAAFAIQLGPSCPARTDKTDSLPCPGRSSIINVRNRLQRWSSQ